MEETLLTVEEVARHLRVSPGAVRLWLRSGDLRGIKAGRQWRVWEGELLAYMSRPAGRGGNDDPQ